jgi:hypothetical protein
MRNIVIAGTARHTFNHCPLGHLRRTIDRGAEKATVRSAFACRSSKRAV